MEKEDLFSSREWVCDDELSREYQRVIDELDSALELFKK